MRCRESPTSAGFTLMEVILAVALLGVISAGVLGMFSFSKRIGDLSAARLTGTYLMQGKMEEALSKEFGKNVGENGFTYSGFPDYSFDVTQTRPYLGYTGLKRVDVTMTWTTPLGIVRNDTLSSLVADVP